MGSHSGTCQVHVTRGGITESVHDVSVAVADAQGRLRAWAGDANRSLFARSAIKAMQALPLLEDGVVEQFGITEEELALCCASHSGEPHHVELATSLLRRIGAGEEALACGPHWPFHDGSARALRSAGARPGRIHNNCSGKHAGMMSLARFHGWSIADYQKAEHPVQQRMLSEVSRWTEVLPEEIGVGVDGCGVATFALPLFALASGFARLSAEARRGTGEPARIVATMLRHPHLVAGTNRLCTAIMEAGKGRIFAKVGAEGVYCVGVPGAELGIALKVHDGAVRAAEPAVIAVLHALGMLSEDEVQSLARWSAPDVRNTREERVGDIRCDVRLETSNG